MAISTTRKASFTVTLSAASSETCSVRYTTLANTAIPGVDFDPTSGTLTFAPGETSKTIDVFVGEDSSGGRTFHVALSNPTNCNITPGGGTGTIGTTQAIGQPVQYFDFAPGQITVVDDLSLAGVENALAWNKSDNTLYVWHSGAWVSIFDYYTPDVPAPVLILSALPDPSTAKDGQIVLNTTDNKLYVLRSGSWTNLIADGTITSTKITDGAISTPKLATNAVTSDKIIANAITAGKVAAGAIGADQIQANAVTSDKIAANSIYAGQIVGGQIQAWHLSVGSLSAISANLGTVTAGYITGPSNYLRIDATNNFIEIWDNS